jgi:hypothetical protein
MVMGYLVRVSKTSVATKRGIPCTKTVLPANNFNQYKKQEIFFMFRRYI